ncbi:MAG: FecR family protein [Blastochloris sp.]|nr:FecR family protein [Blastochloris sp.]
MDTAAIGSVVPVGSSLPSKDTWAAITLCNMNTLHLMPNTKVKVGMKTETGKLSTAISLESGGVFSKVGKRAGLTQDYRVQTPLGIAAARGTDYVTLALPTRMEVWIAEGKVDVLDLKGTKIGEVAASDDKALKVLRTPAILDPKENAAANAAIMTAAFRFAGQTNIANQSIHTKQQQKQELTLEEQDLLKNTIPVKYLVKVRKTN